MPREFDESDCTCHVKQYKDEDFRIFVCTEKREIFLSGKVEHDFYTHDGAECVARMVSKLWQHEGVESIIKQLRKSTKDNRSIPGLLLNVMSTYQEKQEHDTLASLQEASLVATSNFMSVLEKTFPIGSRVSIHDQEVKEFGEVTGMNSDGSLTIRVDIDCSGEWGYTRSVPFSKCEPVSRERKVP
jgi:hypothetical protein